MLLHLRSSSEDLFPKCAVEVDGSELISGGEAERSANEGGLIEKGADFALLL